MSECANCGNKHAHRWRVSYGKDGRTESCDACGNIGSVYLPDVYWPGRTYTSENICDANGRPIPLESRGHKARVMNEMGIQEAGDRYHGTRIGSSGPMTFKKSATQQKAEVRDAIRRAYERHKR